MMLCTGLMLDTFITPLYVPVARPAEFAVMLMGVDANAPTVADAGEALSQDPPELVAAETVKDREPPPTFDTDSARVTAGAPFTKENTIDVGFAPRLG